MHVNCHILHADLIVTKPYNITFIPILYMRKLGPGEVKKFAHHHTALSLAELGLELRSLILTVLVLTHMSLFFCNQSSAKAHRSFGMNKIYKLISKISCSFQ